MYRVEKTFRALSVEEVANHTVLLYRLNDALNDYNGTHTHAPDLEDRNTWLQYQLEQQGAILEHETICSWGDQGEPVLYCNTVFANRGIYEFCCLVKGFERNEDEQLIDFTKYNVEARVVREEITDDQND